MMQWSELSGKKFGSSSCTIRFQIFKEQVTLGHKGLYQKLLLSILGRSFLRLDIDKLSEVLQSYMYGLIFYLFNDPLGHVCMGAGFSHLKKITNILQMIM